jgi:hypothetical protein
MCSCVDILSPEHGGPVDPQWGTTLDQPQKSLASKSLAVKFNHNHDHLGRFASGSGGGGGRAIGNVHEGPSSPHDSGLSVKRQAYANSVETNVARMIPGGKRLPGFEPYDVIAAKPDGAGHHKIEVKSKSFGAKQAASVHENALKLKMSDAKANPHDTYHTVMVDDRHVSEGGAHNERNRVRKAKLKAEGKSAYKDKSVATPPAN